MTDCYREIMRAVQSPYMYDGPDCNQPRPRWIGSAEGDKDGDGEIGSEIKLSAKTFPPGTRIKISVPECPQCRMPRDLPFDAKDDCCDCGYSWRTWDERFT